MKKKLVSLIMVLAMLMSFVPVTASAATSGTCGDNLTWTLDDAGTLTISGTGAMTDWSAGECPWYSSRSSIKNIVIGDSVTTIGQLAFFECSSLTTVTIPDSVTAIGDKAFNACYSLTNVYYKSSESDWDEISIGSSNTYLTRATISYNSTGPATSGTCGDNLTWTLDDAGTLTISGTGAMADWLGSNAPWCPVRNNIKSVIIPDSVTSIGDYAFHDCTSLTRITIPDSVTSIGDYAFYNCDSLTSITIPDSITAISNSAFSACNYLTSVTIPKNITAIGDSAFSACSALTNVYYEGSESDWDEISIGSSNTYLTSATISYNSTGPATSGICGDNLTWTLDDEGTLTINGMGAMTDWLGSNAPWYPVRSNIKSVIIPDSVTSIGTRAFRGCNKLTSITIPDSVTAIGDEAFYMCSKLTGIKVDSNNMYYTSDDYGVLYDINKTTLIQYPAGNARISFSIPNSVTAIGDYAFFTCDNLTSVTIPNSVTTIGTQAFASCNYMTSLTIPDSITAISDEAFRGCSSLTSITIPDSVTAIGNSAFSGCFSLTSITIPDSVTAIGDEAFSYCFSLTSITIPKSVTSIGDQAFENCNKLTSITIPNGVTSIGDEAFRGCSDLTSITIPDGVTSIGDYVFYNCKSLTSVTIPDSVTTIGTRAFERCNLTDIKVDSNNMYYTSDDYGVLYDINKSTLIQYPVGNTRTNFIIPDSVTYIGGGAFSYCDSLTSITIPDSVTYIGGSAFASCTGLTSIIIPDGVTTISNSAFNSCSSLTSVTIPDSVTTIGTRAFFYSSNLTSVTIPDSVTAIGDEAFRGCSDLTSIYYTGSESDWGEISIGSYNEPLTDATIHYNWLDKPTFDSESNSIKFSSYEAITDAQLIVALYQNDRFVDATAVTIDLSAGNNTINSPVTDYSNADTAKIMIWQDMTTLTPLFNVCTVDLR